MSHEVERSLSWQTTGEPSNAFVGRSRELTRIRELLQDRANRLITLTGIGGVGKTRLAFHLMQAGYIPPEFDPIVFSFVSLADSSEFIPSIGLTLGLSVPQESMAANVIAHFSEHPRAIILDNLEHLNVQGDVKKLLDACPDLLVIATSRIELGIQGECVVKVEPFAQPQYVGSVLELEADDAAIELFQTRATELFPRHRLNLEDDRLIRAICGKLDGIPLSIELAVPALRVLSPHQLLSRLRERLPILQRRDLDEADDLRHATMHAVVYWGYERLAPRQQELFRRLAFFRGGFTLEMAEHVARGAFMAQVYPFADGYGVAFPHLDYLHIDPSNEPWQTPADIDPLPSVGALQVDMLSELNQLIISGFIRRVDFMERMSRFMILETIREFGIQQSTELGEFDTFSHLHAAVTLAVFEAGAETLFHESRRIWDNVRLDLELPNLRQALNWAAGKGNAGAEIMQRLAGAPWIYWQTRGLVPEGRRWMEIAFRSKGAAWSNAMYYPAFGFLCWIQGDDVAAEHVLSDGKRLTQSVGLIRSEAAAYLFSAFVAWRGGLNRAPEFSENLGLARELYGAVDDKLGLGACAIAEGVFARSTGDFIAAGSALETALKLLLQVGYEWGVATSRFYAGELQLLVASPIASKLIEALLLLQQSLTGYANGQDPWGVAGILGVIGGHAANRGEYELSARCFGSAFSLVQQIGAVLPPVNLREYSKAADEVRLKLGDAAYWPLYSEGATFQLAQAVQLAREWIEVWLTEYRATARRQEKSTLTNRQIQVLRLVADGLTDQEIALRLTIGKRTVEDHLRNASTRLQVSSRAAAAAVAVRRGLI